MHHLLRKQIVVLLIAIFFTSIVSNAQYKELNRPDHDDLPYYFGMTLAYNSSYLNASKNSKFIADDSIMSVQPGSSGDPAHRLARLRRSDRKSLVKRVLSAGCLVLSKESVCNLQH